MEKDLIFDTLFDLLIKDIWEAVYSGPMATIDERLEQVKVKHRVLWKTKCAELFETILGKSEIR